MNRIKWIDSAKGIGIILIVLGHIYLHENEVRRWLYSFHLPLFFFISGYLFDPKKYNLKKFCIRKVESLMIPYIIFAVISYSYWVSIERYFRPGNMDINPYKPILGYLLGFSGDWMQPNMPLWFLPCLFVTEMLFYLVLLAGKRFKYLSIIVIFNVILWNFGIYSDIIFPWGIYTAFNGILFYYIGYIFKKNNLNYHLKKTMIVKISMLSLFIPLSVWLSWMNGYAEVMMPSKNLLLYYTSAICGIGVIIIAAEIFREFFIFTFLGSNTLIILCTHQPIKRLVVKVVSIITAYDIKFIRSSTIGSIGCTIFVLALMVPIIFIFNNYGYNRFWRAREIVTSDC